MRLGVIGLELARSLAHAGVLCSLERKESAGVGCQAKPPVLGREQTSHAKPRVWRAYRSGVFSITNLTEAKNAGFATARHDVLKLFVNKKMHIARLSLEPAGVARSLLGVAGSRREMAGTAALLFNTRWGEGLEDKKEKRKATRSYGKDFEESANSALMRQGGGEGCGGRG